MIKLSAQDLASYAAVIVACVALYVGWDQSRIIRNQQHADVFPLIQIGTQYLVKENTDGEKYRDVVMTIANVGVGPAFIESSQWIIKDRLISNVSDIEAVLPEGLAPYEQYQGQHSGFLLGAGEQQVVWNAIFTNDEETRRQLDIFMNDFWKMEMTLCYCSLYERCWKTEYGATSPRPASVESCTN